MTLCGHPYCLETIPDDAHHKRKYCSVPCRGAASHLRNRDARNRRRRRRYADNPEPERVNVRKYYQDNKPRIIAVKKSRDRMKKQIAANRDRYAR